MLRYSRGAISQHRSFPLRSLVPRPRRHASQQPVNREVLNQGLGKRPLRDTPTRVSSGKSVVGLETFVQQAQQGNADLSFLEDLLARRKAEIQKVGVSVSDQRRRARARPIGLAVVAGLQMLKGLDSAHVLEKPLCVLLGWHLVAEGNEDTMWRWLTLEGRQILQADSSFHDKNVDWRSKDPVACRTRRRHDLFYGLIVGHLDLAIDGTANDAIRAFQFKHTALSVWISSRTISEVGALVTLHKALRTSLSLPCDSQLFDWFVEKASSSDGAYGLVRYADQLPLYHPQRPSALPFLKRYRAISDQLATNARGVKARNHVGSCLIRAMFLLILQGAENEARWTAGEIMKQYPRVWTARAQVFHELSEDPKLQHLIDRSDASSTHASIWDVIDGPSPSPRPRHTKDKAQLESTRISKGDAIQDYLALRGFGKD